MAETNTCSLVTYTPLELIKTDSFVLPTLLCPNTGYLNKVKQVYEYRKLNTHNSQSADTEKPTLILDIDRTLLVKYPWIDSLEVGQAIIYENEPATVKEIHYVVEFCNLSNTSKRPCKLQHFLLFIRDKKDSDKVPNEGDIVMKNKIVISVSVYQMVIKRDENTIDPNLNESVITINPEKHRDRLSKISLLPPQNMKDDVIVYKDLFIALRPGLAEFLHFCARLYDVKLFTSNKKASCRKLMKYIHKYLVNKLTQKYNNIDANNLRLWDENIFYRNKCEVKNGGKISKNIFKFGVDLSRIIMVDSNPHNFRGFDPNCIKIKQYVPNTNDITLQTTILPLLFKCSSYEDVRYGLLGQTKMKKTKSIQTEQQSLLQTMEYLVALQYIYAESTKLLNLENVSSNQYLRYPSSSKSLSTSNDVEKVEKKMMNKKECEDDGCLIIMDQMQTAMTEFRNHWNKLIQSVWD